MQERGRRQCNLSLHKERLWFLHFVAVAARGSPNLYFNNVMSNVNVKLLCKPYDLLEGIGMNTRSHDIFIDTFEFFCRLNSTLRNFILHLLSVQTLCIFPCKPALPLHLIPCCTGAEHYVNLVIGTGPSPLYGFLLSRSTWLVKEDGMKINEVQLIQEGGTSPTLPLRR